MKDFKAQEARSALKERKLVISELDNAEGILMVAKSFSKVGLSVLDLGYSGRLAV